MAILWLNQIGRKDLPRVGGKASHLGEMLQAGLPIPMGFCVPITFDRSNNPQITDAMRREILEGRDHLLQNHQAECFAVRSSAVQEDAPSRSFAGQFKTILGVVEEDELLQAIEQCARSVHERRVRSYAQAGGIRLQYKLSVIIQILIPAEKSGILFTKDPITYEHIFLIEASWGLGDLIVGGQITPDLYTVEIEEVGDDLIVRERHFEWGSKRQTSTWRDGRVVRRETDPERQKQRCLTEGELQEICRLGKRIQELFGCAQDIEWAIWEDNVYILQSRPITIQ